MFDKIHTGVEQGDMPLRVYVVEDNAAVRASLIELLEEISGVAVVGFSLTEPEASYWLQKNPDAWDLAVVDLFLEQGNGLGILESCQERLPLQKVVMLSNFASPAVEERCRELGADAMFDKSLGLEEFSSYVQSCVSSRGGSAGAMTPLSAPAA